MKLLDRTFAWLANRLKAYMPGPGGIGSVDGAWSSPSYDYESLGNAFIVNPWVHACVSRQAEVVSSIPIKVYREQPDGESEEVTDHPLRDLLWNPGRFSGGTEGFLYNTVADFRLNGELFWYVENGSQGTSLYPAEIKELRIFKSQQIRINPDPLDIIGSYTYANLGSDVTFEPEFIVHAKTYNPSDIYRGLPPLEVARHPVLLEYYMTRYNERFFQNGAPPGQILSTDQALKEDTQAALKRVWDRQHKGVENSHKTAIMSHGLKPHSMAISNKDAEFIGLNDLTIDQILAIYNMPHIMVGLSESVNYANGREQVRIFFKYTIKPICRFIAGAINTQLIPTWYGNDKGLYVAFDFSNEEALQADAHKKAQERQIYVNSGVMTPNEVRRELGLPDIEGGDDLKSSSSGFGGLLSNQAPTTLKAVIPPTRVDQWKARDRDFIASERKIERTMVQFFKDQGARVVTALDGQGVLAGVAPNAPETAEGVSSVRQIEPSQLFSIFDIDDENHELLEALMPIIQDIMEQAGNGALAAVGSGALFKVNDPRVQAFLAKKELLLQRINNTTLEAIRSILVDTSAEGVSVAETGRRIRDKFSDFSKSRADTIARTEAVAANNAAAIEGYRQSEVVEKKEWLTAPGASTPRHELVPGLDGQQVGLDEMFDVNGNPMPSPGVDGPPEEVINCRCTVLPVLED